MHDEFAEVLPALELLERVTEYVELASSLSKECNIPHEHFLALCRALEDAYDAYDDYRFEKGRGDSIRANLKAARALRLAMTRGLAAFNSLDAATRVTILRHVEAKHDAAVFEVVQTKLGESKLRRLTLDGLFSDIAEAADKCIESVRLPRARPADVGLRAFVAVLRQFWVGELSRPFYDNFQEDFELSDDPDRGMYIPANDASRFIVEAVQALIGDVNVGTCRHMMRAVNKAT